MNSEEAKNRVFRIRQVLSGCEGLVEYKIGQQLHKELKALAKDFYVPKHTPEEYIKFMNEHYCSFEENHPQSMNHPCVLTMFSIYSQHVMGDCVEECLDKAIDGGDVIALRDALRKRY